MTGCGEFRINDVTCVFSAGMTVVVEPDELHGIADTDARIRLSSVSGSGWME